MLWSDLDISALNNGADELEKKCRKFPKELKVGGVHRQRSHVSQHDGITVTPDHL